jgi:hypothetical protein
VLLLLTLLLTLLLLVVLLLLHWPPLLRVCSHRCWREQQQGDTRR